MWIEWGIVIIIITIIDKGNSDQNLVAREQRRQQQSDRGKMSDRIIQEPLHKMRVDTLSYPAETWMRVLVVWRGWMDVHVDFDACGVVRIRRGWCRQTVSMTSSRSPKLTTLVTLSCTCSWRSSLDANQSRVNWWEDFRRNSPNPFWHDCKYNPEPSYRDVHLRLRVEWVLDNETEVFRRRDLGEWNTILVWGAAGFLKPHFM